MMNRIILTFLLLLAVPVAANAATATVHLPKTGQTLCFDLLTGAAIACAGTGQDGETLTGATWPIPRFTDNGNGTVTDDLTGLIWLKDANCATLNPGGAGVAWADAVTGVNALQSGQCGLTDTSVAGDWRLPNVNEMESLMSLARIGPPIPPTDPADPTVQIPVPGIDYSKNPFIDTLQPLLVSGDSEYWTSTITAVFTPNAEGVNMYIGNVRGDVRTNLKHVWAVKGAGTKVPKTGQTTCWATDGTAADCTTTPGADGDLKKGIAWPDPRFTDNNNGTMTDKLTGLVWLKRADCYVVNQTTVEAFANAQALADGTCGLTDQSTSGQWRVPNRTEMRSLVNYGDTLGTWLNTQGFTGTTPGWYWTSDSYPDAGEFAVEKWMVNTGGGAWLSSTVTRDAPLAAKMLLPVRGGLNATITITPETLQQTYDGSPRAVAATTEPAGLTPVITYAGSSTAPTDAGSYPVLVTVSDANYLAEATGTLVIAKAATGSVTIDSASLSPNYDGTPKSATATTTPAGAAVTFTYSGSPTPPTEPGTYDVVATMTNYTATDSKPMTIGKATPAITWADPASIPAGTALSATQLNAAANVDGTFVYTPALGSVPTTGTQTLSCTFTPTDTARYTPVTVQRQLTVTGFTVDASVDGGNGTISCTSPVTSGGSSTCTITPATGYHLVTLTDNGTDKLSAASGTTYTISGVAENHTVTGSFARPDGMVTRAGGKTRPDVTDALAVLKMVNNVTPATAADKARCDVAPLANDGTPQGNGTLDVYDVIGILRMAIGL